MQINQQILEKIPILAETCKKHKVSKLYLFGSVLTENFNNQSDIDMLVEFDEKLSPVERGELYWQLDEILPEILSRKVDIVTIGSLKNKYFIQNINKTKFTIYE